jgi:hypothetical protein
MMAVTLLSGGKQQYKANLHCHSTRSDGRLTPKELVASYRAEGYQILAITDHCSPKDHSALGDEGFLLLTGYEAYIRPAKTAVCDPFSPEIHLNLFAKDPKNESLICYNEAYTKYIPKELHAGLCRVGSEEPRQYTTEYVNRFIETANAAGYLVAYNHPVWSMEEEARVLSYRGLFSLELYNTSSFCINRMEGGEVLYDKLLRCGLAMGCHAGDDNHAYDDRFGWYTVILADSLTYEGVIRALEAKDFYASRGPRLDEITVEDVDGGQVVRVVCSAASEVYLHVGSKSPVSKKLPRGESATEFTLPLPERAAYFRVSVYDAEGRSANSRGFFRREWEET